MRQLTAIPPMRHSRRTHAPSSRDVAIDIAFVALLPFVQTGISYWASVATLATLLVIVRGARAIQAGLASEWLWLLALPVMFASVLLEGGGDSAKDLLRIAREAVFFLLMLALLRGSVRLPPRINERLLIGSVLVFTGCMLLYTAMEYVSLLSGRYIGFPTEVYVQGQDTVPSALTLRYSHVRPAGSYTEPSYLGFVLLSVLMLALPAPGRRFGYPALVFMVVACGILSQAASFMLFAGLIGAIVVAQRQSARGKILLLPVAIVGFAALLAFGSDAGVLARVLSGTTAQGDFSVFVRIFGPAQVLPSFLIEHPLGLPFSRLPEAIAPYTLPLGVPPDQYLMNGLFNLFFEFGILGFALAFALLSIRDTLLRTYILSCMLFNGGFLAIDKLAVIGFTVMVYCAMQRNVEPERKASGGKREPLVLATRRPAVAWPVKGGKAW